MKQHNDRERQSRRETMELVELASARGGQPEGQVIDVIAAKQHSWVGSQVVVARTLQTSIELGRRSIGAVERVRPAGFIEGC